MTPFPRDAYRSLVPYIPDLRTVEVDISDNTSLWGPHPAAVQVLREAGGDDLARYPSGYGEPLKEAVVNRFQVPVDSVATDCGSDDLLDSAFRASCDPGDRVAFPAPTFGMVPLLARMNGLDARPVPGPARTGERTDTEEAAPSFLPTPEALLSEDPSVVYLCSPNNPTGEVAPRDWIMALVEAAQAPGGPVVVADEAYAEFHDFSLLREAPELKRVVVTRTFSKAYGLAGLRVGYAVGDPELIHEIEKSRGPYKVGRLSERAAAAALGDNGRWLGRVVREVRENRERLEKALRERGVPPLPSGANFLFVPVPDGGGGSGGSEPSFEEAPAMALGSALRRRNVAVRPFPHLPGVGGGLRITVGPWEAMERLLTALDEALDEQSEGTD